MRHVLTYSLRELSYKPHTLDCSCQFHAELPNMEAVNAWAGNHYARHQHESDFSFEKVGFPEPPAPVVEEPVKEAEEPNVENV